MIGRWFSRLSTQPTDTSLGLQVTRLPALLLGVQGLLNLIWAVIPDGITWPVRLGQYAPLFTDTPGRLFNLVFGIGLIVLAGAMRRQKTYAWMAGAVLCLAAAGRDLWNGPDWVRVGLAVGLAAWLVLTRKGYIARSNWDLARKGARVWLGLLFAVLLAGMIGFGRLAAENGSEYGPVLGVLRSLAMFILFHDPWIEGGVDTNLWLSTAIYVAAVIAWGYLLVMLDQPLPGPPVATADDHRRAREIVRRWGRNSQAHLTLLPDKRYFFTPGGSVTAYSVCGRVALTLGDPIGPREDAPPAILAYRDFCARRDWMPAFCLTTSDYLDVYHRAGFEHMCMGHEGVVDLRSFTLKGNSAKTIRKRFNRLTAAGYRVEICDPPVPDEIVRELHKISDEWLGMASAAEKRFFLAWFDDDYVRGERIAVARRPDGTICAFTNLVPEYTLNEISIDLMRRRTDVESGTMDFLFVSLMLWARDHGYDTFNLGLSPLFGVGERPGRPALERGIHYMYHHGNFYDFKGLNGFKIKFRPNWAPQYMIYPGLLALGWVWLAMARINAGENETLFDYFRTRPKVVEHADPDDLPLLAPESQGD